MHLLCIICSHLFLPIAANRLDSKIDDDDDDDNVHLTYVMYTWLVNALVASCLFNESEFIINSDLDDMHDVPCIALLVYYKSLRERLVTSYSYVIIIITLVNKHFVTGILSAVPY